MKIAGIVAIVTGGASGLGEAAARALVKAGARVALFDMDQERGRAVAQDLGDSARFFAIDITSEEAVARAIDSTVEAFGALHAAINCAGVATPGKIVGKKGPLPLDRFNKVVAINLSGTFNIMRLAAVKMMENAPNQDGEKGVVINTASVAAFEGQIGQAAYAASKAAVAGLTLPAAREFADYGIRVVCIAPGLFMTPMLMGLPEKAQQSLAEMMPFPKRLGYPSEYAALVMHIIENAMLNGETIRLDAALRMAAK